jgi:succinoglycan biosynthesis transport protein ExoP
MRNLINGEVETSAPASAIKPAGKHVSILDGWREHPWLTASIFLIGVIAGLPAAWILGKPEYVAEATVYVSPTFMKNLEEDSEQKRQYDTFVQQQVNTITRFDILSESLASAKEVGFVWARPDESEKEAIERLKKSLEIRRIPDTYQIAVALRSPKSKGLAEFVNGLTENFLAKARAEEFYGQKERLQTLESERAVLDKELLEKGGRLAELAGILGVANFSPTLPNPYDLALTKFKEELNGARSRRLEAEVAIETNDPKKMSESGALAKALGADVELSRLRTALNTRRMELTTALQGLGPDHPVRLRAERELQENETELIRVTDRTRERLAAQLAASAAEELRKTRHVEAGLMSAIATQSALAGRFSRTLQEGVTLTNEIERMRARRNTIDDRIRYLTVEASAPGFLRMFSQAQTPEEPTKGRRTLLFAVMLAFTFAMVCFVPVSLELMNTRVRNAASVERVIGFTPVGQLLSPESGNDAFRQEQIARLVTGLERSHQSMMATTFLLSSIDVNTENTALALLIAAELKKRGKRTLVIETGDPDIGEVPSRVGLQDVLDDSGNLPAAIFLGRGGDADRIQAGLRRHGTRFSNIHKMPELLEKLHARYDLILLAADPLFVSSDTEFLVRCADVTLLNVDAQQVRLGELERARQMLERLQPGGLGVIITEMRLSDAGSVLNVDFHQFERHRTRTMQRRLAAPRQAVQEKTEIVSLSLK